MLRVVQVKKYTKLCHKYSLKTTEKATWNNSHVIFIHNLRQTVDNVHDMVRSYLDHKWK